MLARDNSEWLRGFHEWRNRQIATSDYYRQEHADSKLARQLAGQFTYDELVRLEVYRRAVMAGFYNDGGPVTNVALA